MTKIKSLFLLPLLFAANAFALPFQPGEQLTYSVQWKYGLVITAGYLTTTIQAPIAKDGNTVYPIVAAAKSNGVVNSFYPFGYTIRSLWDQKLFSRSYEMHGKEKSERKDQIETYNYAAGQAIFSEKTSDEKKGKAPTDKNETYPLAEGSQDVLSTLYYLRSIDLPTDSKTVRIPVAVDGKPWEAVVKFLETDTVKFNGQKLDTNVYQLDFYKEGKFDNGGTKMWITTDSRRLILKLDTKVKVGKIWVKLDSVK